MEGKRWETAREVYVKFRATKRQVNAVSKECNKTYVRLENALKRYMKAQTEALAKFTDEEQVYKLVQAYRDFQEAKRNHDETRHALDEALKAFRDQEIAYSIVIFKELRSKYGMTFKNLAEVFGILDIVIGNWVRDGETNTLKEVYDEEFKVDDDN